jgi:hypothetical protein
MIWIISIALVASLAINALLLWYIRQTLKKLLFASENFGWIKDSLLSYSQHLEAVHELEMFYGDDTLGSLIKHSRDLVADIKNFEEIYTLTEEDIEDDTTEKEEE